jgi:hypothetical protein
MRNQSTLRTHYRLHHKEVEEQQKKGNEPKKSKRQQYWGRGIEEQEYKSLPHLVVNSLLEATVKNTIVVENGTTMEMTTTDTTISDRSAVERVSTQVEHPALLSTESQDLDNHKQKFLCKRDKGFRWWRTIFSSPIILQGRKEG